MMKKILFVCLILLPATLLGQQELTLEQAISRGLENNYQIKIAAKNTEVAENNDSWGNAGLYPSIDLGISSVNRHDDQGATPPATGRSRVTNNIFTPYVQMSWVLFRGFGIWIGKENLEDLKKLTYGAEAVTVETTVQEIIMAYYKAALEKEMLKSTEKLLDLSRDKYERIQASKDLGASVSFDVLQFRNTFLRDSSSLIMQQINYRNALRNLVMLMGEDPEMKFDPVDKFEFDAPEYDKDSLQSKMLNDNKNLKNKLISQKMAANYVSMAKSAYYPTISMSAGYDYQDITTTPENIDPIYDHSKDYYANITLNWNIFNGNNTNREVENAKIEEELGRIEIAELQHRLRNTLENLYELYLLRRQMYQLTEASLEAATLNMQIAEDKFKSGAINSFNYRDIQLAYINASYDRLQAVYNLIDINTELLRITGGIITEK